MAADLPGTRPLLAETRAENNLQPKNLMTIFFYPILCHLNFFL